MPQSVFNRYEKKYLMPERVYQGLRGRLSPYMQVDSYGLHTICNIYYDTPDDLLIVHFDDVAVYRHLAKIRSHVLCTELFHLRFDEVMFVFRIKGRVSLIENRRVYIHRLCLLFSKIVFSHRDSP